MKYDQSWAIRKCKKQISLLGANTNYLDFREICRLNEDKTKSAIRALTLQHLYSTLIATSPKKKKIKKMLTTLNKKLLKLQRHMDMKRQNYSREIIYKATISDSAEGM